MQLNNFFRFSIIFLISTSVCALVELKTKQENSKIKTISKNGKITYYQKSSGELHYSTNYNFEVIFKEPKGTSYNVVSSPNEKYILIEKEKNIHQLPNLQKDNQIFVSSFGSKKNLREVGKGITPKLHLNDDWISFYQHKTKTLNIISSKDFSNKLKTIQLKNQINPYFRPEVSLLSPHDIIYTDINKDGMTALFSYSFIDKKFKVLYKSKLPGQKIEICRIKDDLIVGEFPYHDVKGPSQIISIPIYNNIDLKQYKTLYFSSLNDTGNLVCFKNSIFFIKTTDYNERLNYKTTSIAKIINEKLSKIPKSQNIKQLTVLGNLLIGNRLGKNYIISGENLILNDEIKKDKEK